MSGSPCIEGRRIRVEDVAGRFAGGDTVEQICRDYELTSEQVMEALRAVVAASFGQRGMFANVERELIASVPVQLT